MTLLKVVLYKRYVILKGKRAFMNKSLFIAEKPSVAGICKSVKSKYFWKDGYLESENTIITLVCGTFGDHELSGSL